MRSSSQSRSVSEVRENAAEALLTRSTQAPSVQHRLVSEGADDVSPVQVIKSMVETDRA